MAVRIIPRLDIKGATLVKGIQLEGLRVLGTAADFARAYYEAGADELLYIDVVATLYGRNSLVEMIRRTAREIFIPLTVGGGLRTLDDIRAALCAGADKVAINTAAVTRPAFIQEAARRFGSSAVVVSIEAKKRSDGSYEAYAENGRVPTGQDAIRWAKQAADLGAGEILITSIDREGTGSGFDCPLTGQIAQAVGVPVIACGGAGSAAHVVDVIRAGKADAVAIASLLHYELVRRAAVLNAQSPPNRGLQLARSSPRAVAPMALPALKRALTETGVDCRYDSCDAHCGRTPSAASCHH